MHDRKHPLVRLATGVLPVSAVLVTVLVTGTGVAGAAQNTHQIEAEISSFGLLGPVGLAAVALGVIGMALGVLRQRRKAQAAAAQQQVEPAPVPVEDPARLEPYRQSA